MDALDVDRHGQRQVLLPDGGQQGREVDQRVHLKIYEKKSLFYSSMVPIMAITYRENRQNVSRDKDKSKKYVQGQRGQKDRQRYYII